VEEPVGTPQPAAVEAEAPAAASDPQSLEDRLAAAIEAANAEITADPVAPSPPERTDTPTPVADPGPAEEAGPRPDDDQPNPDLPQLTRGQTRRLFEQWESERRPRFFRDLEQAQAEAADMRAQAEAAAQADAEARAGYEQWYGPDQHYQQAERHYDQIVDKLQRGEYVPDQEIQQARAFVTWRDNRRMAGAVHQRELGKVMANVDRLFRQAKVDGLDVAQVLADVSKQGGHPGAVLEAIAARVRDEWKGRYEAEKAAHEATRVRAGLGRAPGGAPAGGAAPRGDLSSVLGSLRPGTDAAEAFVERALKGDLSHLDLADR